MNDIERCINGYLGMYQMMEIPMLWIHNAPMIVIAFPFYKFKFSDSTYNLDAQIWTMILTEDWWTEAHLKKLGVLDKYKTKIIRCHVGTNMHNGRISHLTLIEQDTFYYEYLWHLPPHIFASDNIIYSQINIFQISMP